MLLCVDQLDVDDADVYSVGRCTVTTVFLHSDLPTQCAQSLVTPCTQCVV
jgi:hypothetical protein